MYVNSYVAIFGAASFLVSSCNVQENASEAPRAQADSNGTNPCDPRQPWHVSVHRSAEGFGSFLTSTSVMPSAMELLRRGDVHLSLLRSNLLEQKSEVPNFWSTPVPTEAAAKVLVEYFEGIQTQRLEPLKNEETVRVGTLLLWLLDAIWRLEERLRLASHSSLGDRKPDPADPTWQAVAALRRVYDQVIAGKIMNGQEIWSTVELMNRWNGTNLSKLAFQDKVDGEKCQKLGQIVPLDTLNEETFRTTLRSQMLVSKQEVATECTYSGVTEYCWGIGAKTLGIGRENTVVPNVARLACTERHKWEAAYNFDPVPDAIPYSGGGDGRSLYGNPDWYKTSAFVGSP